MPIRSYFNYFVHGAFVSFLDDNIDVVKCISETTTYTISPNSTESSTQTVTLNTTDPTATSLTLSSDKQLGKSNLFF